MSQNNCGCFAAIVNGPATECQCETADAIFTCFRHNCQKSPHLQNLCRTRPEYFHAWEEGVGPMQDLTPGRSRIGLGDVAAGIIKVMTFGTVKMCAKCQARRSRWNRWLSVPVPGMTDLRAVASWLGGDDAAS